MLDLFIESSKKLVSSKPTLINPKGIRGCGAPVTVLRQHLRPVPSVTHCQEVLAKVSKEHKLNAFDTFEKHEVGLPMWVLVFMVMFFDITSFHSARLV